MYHQLQWSSYCPPSPRVVLPGGVCLPRGESAQGRCTPPSGPRETLTPPAYCMLGYTPQWIEFLTHACENITFPQLLFRAVINPINLTNLPFSGSFCCFFFRSFSSSSFFFLSLDLALFFCRELVISCRSFIVSSSWRCRCRQCQIMGFIGRYCI